LAINKNFVIKNGLEVDNNLIFADSETNRVGILTSIINHELDVNGGIGASTVTVRDELVLEGTLKAGTAIGQTGAYLISTGNGVEWQTLPNTRQVIDVLATPGQDTFSITYLVGLIDVFINGVKLSNDEFVANDGISVVLNDSCFGGETVEFIIYSAYNVGGGEGIGGITILDEGSIIGSPAAVNSINFVGAAITTTSTGFGVTVFITDDAAIWTKNEYDEVYLADAEKIGIGTEFPEEAIHAIGSAKIDGDINFTGDLYQGGELFQASNWIVGSGTTIYRESFVGIGSTLPQKTLDVGGDINFSGDLYKEGSLFIASRWTSDNGTDIYKLTGNVGLGTTNPTQTLDVNGNVRIRGDLYSSENNVGTAGSILYTAGSGSGIYWGPPVGAQGTMGIQGLEGAQGLQGTQGVQGLSNQGVQGTQGLDGTQGLQGTQGVQGLSNQGVQGTQGIQGELGTQGSQGVQGLSNQGVQGQLGAQGLQGVQGELGTQGLQGVQGLSNQGVQGTIGAQGIQGVQGLSNQGVQGTQGRLGVQGTQGVQGLSNQGVQGTQGRLGAQGTQGVQGLSNQGVQGTQGRLGAQGTQGTFGPATIPQNSQTTSYVLQSSDNGKHISITTGGVTVPQNIFVSGENVVVFNDSGSNQTITSGIGITMYLAGTASTGNRTLLQRGLATVLCISSNRFVISGAGLT
jgi:hypothetical protein